MDATTTATREPRTDARGLEYKTRGLVELRAAGEDLAAGEFRALVAVFGNVDSTGDRIRKGAFAHTLQPPPAGRGLPPIVFAHNWDGYAPVGVTLDATETDEGLQIHGRLSIDYQPDKGIDHPKAREVYTAMTQHGGDGRPALREFSFGFRTVRSEWVTDTIDDLEVDVRELVEVELYEVGPVLVGANSATRLDQIKTAAPAPHVRRRTAPAALPAAATTPPRHL